MRYFSFLSFALIVPLAASPYVDSLVRQAREKIAKYPRFAEAYIDLSFALGRQARETGDSQLYSQAEEAAARALLLEPGSFEARKARAVARIGEERYADALEELQTLNREIPDDNLIYGLISDAQCGLGKYREAEAAVQKMLDMRQVNAPGLARGARMRFVMGYPEGALEWYGSALRLTSVADAEERAYLATQMAGVHREMGKLEAASEMIAQAVSLVPGYPAALDEQARLLLARDEPAKAVAVLRDRIKAQSNLESRYWLTVALERAGDKTAAASEAREFEREARTLAGKPHNADPLLVMYLAGHDRAREAVEYARSTCASRRDIAAQHALAWALYRAGKPAESREHMERALEYGIRDAELFYHAGLIAREAGDRDQSDRYLKNAIQTNSTSKEAAAAIRLLALTNTTNGVSSLVPYQLF